MLVPGIAVPMEEKVSFAVVSGSLSLHKYDFDSKICQAKRGWFFRREVFIICIRRMALL